MIDIEARHEVQGGSNRNFGFVFAFVFTIIGLWPLIHSGGLRYWSLIIAAAFVLITLLRPSLLSGANRLWTKFGLLLGAIVAPIVMALVYFLTVTPTGLIMRALGKDLLRQKLDKGTNTYWIERAENVGPMRNQF
ncbi:MULTISPECIES: SxtJ family membrane protein [Ruegeria]|uniref:SxtJ family membrane protein n=1 Tax=Ruegeria TaxID=97050 RepID=UPI00147B5446|nr:MULTISPECIES: SxtJ family membrane protein [Ruegeria]